MDKMIENNSEVLDDQSEPVQSSRYSRITSDEQEFIKDLTMRIQETLHAHPLIKDIRMTVRPPVTAFLLTSWERRHGLRLPTDLRNYYSSTNGFELTWSLVYGDELLKVGSICVNTFEDLIPIETELESKEPDIIEGFRDLKPFPHLNIKLLTDIQIKKGENDQTGGGRKIPKAFFGSTIKAFKIDSSRPESGTVYLVYRNVCRSGETQPESSSRKTHHNPNPPVIEPDVQIWFLDRSFQWHFLAPNFSIYYSMAIFHLGLPDWTYRFTPFGLSSWTEQIFWLVAPNLLRPVKYLDPNSDSSGVWSNDVPEEAATPNTTPNVLTNSMFKKKKKEQKPQKSD